MLLVDHFLLYFSLMLFFCHYVHGYRKYYVEDECIPSDKKQKITLRLPSTGPDSVGEIRSNRFGTYSRTERSCLFKLTPPDGYGVVLTVLKIDFRNFENCKDFIKIITEDDEEEKLCGYQELGLKNHTYYSEDGIRVYYQTSGRGIGFNQGIRLIFTVSKLGECTPDAFKCRNSHCIWAGVTCDGINNCEDASDENFLEYPYCRTYQQISKNLFPLLAEITPVAVIAVILGIISFVSIVVAMCVCCCRSRPEKPEKPYLFREFSAVPNGGYITLPGYRYGSMDTTYRYMQPVHSSGLYPSAPMHTSCRCHNSNVPLVHKKVEIRYERPPPPYDG